MGCGVIFCLTGGVVGLLGGACVGVVGRGVPNGERLVGRSAREPLEEGAPWFGAWGGGQFDRLMRVGWAGSTTSEASWSPVETMETGRSPSVMMTLALSDFASSSKASIDL